MKKEKIPVLLPYWLKDLKMCRRSIHALAFEQ